MENYIDGFVLPVPRVHLNDYKGVAEVSNLSRIGSFGLKNESRNLLFNQTHAI